MNAVEEDDYVFTWKIKRVNSLKKIYCECLSSHVFKIDFFNESEWKVHLYPRTKTDNLECQIERIANIANSTNEKITINFRYELVNCSGVVFKTSEQFNKTFTEGSRSDICRLIALDVLEKEILRWPKDLLIFRCHMTNAANGRTSTSSSNCEVETDFRSNKPSFMWLFKFTNVDNWFAKKKIKLENISIEVTFKYEDEEIKIELLSTINDNWTHYLTCDVELIDVAGKDVVYGEGENEFNAKNNLWKFPSFLTKQYLVQAECFIREEIRVKFSIMCFYSFISKIRYFSLDVIENEDMKLLNENLRLEPYLRTQTSTAFDSINLEELKSLPFAETKADVTLRVSSAISTVHRGLMAEKSPIFSSFIEQYITKNNTDIVDVPDMYVMTMRSFVEYINYDTVKEMDVETALDLIIMVDKYHLLPLLEMCSNFLESNISTTNALEILSAAGMINLNSLKLTAQNYIVENSFEVLSSLEWPKWIKCNLSMATEILLKLSKKMLVKI